MKTRRVIFSLTKPHDYGYDPEMTRDDKEQREERMREREGFFHCWHEVEEKSIYSDNFILKKVALIEDLETGKVHEVSHEYFNFLYE